MAFLYEMEDWNWNSVILYEMELEDLAPVLWFSMFNVNFELQQGSKGSSEASAGRVLSPC